MYTEELERKMMGESQSTDLDFFWNEQKKHGIETKYRFGFAYIYLKKINRKIMG